MDESLVLDRYGSSPIVNAEHLALFNAKLLKCQEEAGAVKKDGTCKFGSTNFSFVSCDAITDLAKRIFVANRMLLEERVTRSSTRGGIVVVDTEFTLTDVETGTAKIYTWQGEGKDSTDKALNKSFTQSRKTFLLHLLMVPSGNKYMDTDYGLYEIQQEAQEKKVALEEKAEKRRSRAAPSKEDIIKYVTGNKLEGKRVTSLGEKIGIPLTTQGRLDMSKSKADQRTSLMKQLEFLNNG